jgi:hypothetical protein
MDELSKEVILDLFKKNELDAVSQIVNSNNVTRNLALTVAVKNGYWEFFNEIINSFDEKCMNDVEKDNYLRSVRVKLNKKPPKSLVDVLKKRSEKYKDNKRVFELDSQITKLKEQLVSKERSIIYLNKVIDTLKNEYDEKIEVLKESNNAKDREINRYRRTVDELSNELTEMTNKYDQKVVELNTLNMYAVNMDHRENEKTILVKQAEEQLARAKKEKDELAENYKVAIQNLTDELNVLRAGKTSKSDDGSTSTGPSSPPSTKPAFLGDIQKVGQQASGSPPSTKPANLLDAIKKGSQVLKKVDSPASGSPPSGRPVNLLDQIRNGGQGLRKVGKPASNEGKPQSTGNTTMDALRQKMEEVRGKVAPDNNNDSDSDSGDWNTVSPSAVVDIAAEPFILFPDTVKAIFDVTTKYVSVYHGVSNSTFRILGKSEKQPLKKATDLPNEDLLDIVKVVTLVFIPTFRHDYFIYKSGILYNGRKLKKGHKMLISMAINVLNKEKISDVDASYLAYFDRCNSINKPENVFWFTHFKLCKDANIMKKLISNFYLDKDKPVKMESGFKTYKFRGNVDSEIMNLKMEMDQEMLDSLKNIIVSAASSIKISITVSDNDKFNVSLLDKRKSKLEDYYQDLIKKLKN